MKHNHVKQFAIMVIGTVSAFLAGGCNVPNPPKASNLKSRVASELRTLCVVEVKKRLIGLANEYVFDTTQCTIHDQVTSDVAIALTNLASAEFNSFHTAETNLNHALNVLSRDDTPGSGSPAYPTADLEKVKSLYESGKVEADISIGFLQTNDRGGTGTATLLFFYPDPAGKVIVLKKNTYCE